MQIWYLDVSEGESLILSLGRKAQVLLHYFLLQVCNCPMAWKE